MFRINIQPDKVVDEDDPDLTLLDVSHKHGIPHAAACGGHGRCSTCRVMVLNGLENLTPRTEAELQLAASKGLEADIRLACQTYMLGPVAVRRLVLDDCDKEMAQPSGMHSSGRETTLAILFSDVRNFTHFAETHLAYDVVHILNRYFRRMGDAVLENEGHIDKTIGDGLMALFGLDRDDPALACEQAVRAALNMVDELPGINEYLGRHFDTKFDIGIGIHVGEVIVADMGHPRFMQLTAIGDPVNVASRIESKTKEIGAKLLVSADVVNLLGDKVRIGRSCQVLLRGKQEPMGVREILGISSKANP